MDAGVLIRLAGVRKQFGRKVVLDSIDLDICAGELFGIIGASGAGKTTLLKTIVGFLEPDEGEVLFGFRRFLKSRQDSSGLSPLSRKPSRQFNRLFGFATQEASFYPRLTVEENLLYFAGLYGIAREEARENADAALGMVNLSRDRHTLAENLSQGMKKRLDIACAIVHNPKILILDEPTGDLDPALRQQIWQLIKKINESGVTIIVASHFLDELKPLCRRIALLANSRIAAVGSGAELDRIFSGREAIRIKSLPGNYRLLEYWTRSQASGYFNHISVNDKELVVYTQHSTQLAPWLFSLARYCQETVVNFDIQAIDFAGFG